MPFYTTFTPDQWDDDCTMGVLCTAVARSSSLIEPGDLLAAIIHENNSTLQALLSQALRPPHTLGEIHAVASRRLPEASPPRLPKEGAFFSPRALQALSAYTDMYRAQPAGLAGREIEAFLHTVLLWLSLKEHQEWNLLDISALITLLDSRGSATQEALSAQMPHSAQQAPSSLPEGLAPVEDLTQHARQLGAQHASPFSDDPVFAQLFDQIARALHRREGHLLLIGERGVGQTTLLGELAILAAQGQITTLCNKRFILADGHHTPPEHRLGRLQRLLATSARNAEWVVCLNGLGSLLRSERGTSHQAALLTLLPQMRGKLIGLISPNEYEEIFAGNAELCERFTALALPEPNGETAFRLVTRYASGLEASYQIRIEPERIRQAIALATDHILHERLPGKAINILRRACDDVAYEQAQHGGVQMRLAAEDVIQAVSHLSGVPDETLRGVAEQSDYQDILSQDIAGQDHAVQEVAAELGLIKAGLVDPGKPASVMLFVGQTGTGKTEMAKILARSYSRSKRLRTYALGNFVEPHSVASIIGVPPGYVGHEQGGRIVADLNSDPYCVVLLDEADKAHPDVLQPFLNLFDEGWISDQRGVKAYGDKAIFILTTNVGQRMLADMACQGKTIEEMTTRMKEALAQIRHNKSNRPVFAPEFLARIKRIVVFQPLTQEAMHGICQKLLRKMQSTWRDKRQKQLLIPDALITHIAREAHRRNDVSQGREGGRVVRKLIAEWIEGPIQRAATAQPAAYHACDAISLKLRVADAAVEDQKSPPEVTVHFRRPAVDQQRPGEEQQDAQ